ncbi:MAG: formate--tetrahydrofolate ligase [Dysgonamonadaceae bacterium]|jgi:formate--tetrahydrofolate ligase|nr:formate--tetrahydrofolate ligase [Dysgonamonadaceae bacterium]
MLTDIEIANTVELNKIKQIAKTSGIPVEEIMNYGKYIAKVPVDLINENNLKQSNLILVTAITPTKAGIGKTTVSIGISLGLNKIGKKSSVALREPSLGPCFGMKGGAAGGGYSQVLPMENINLHFTGDFHAVTSAHNMITALLDNYLYQNRGNNEKNLKEILWKRVLDVNDRSLRKVITGLGSPTNGIPTETGFDITPASEIMAILCLAENLDDLKHRIGEIILGIDYNNQPFKVKQLGIEGAITVLLKDTIHPNIVQTTENTPAFVHGGPFANIAHGCNSIVATKIAMTFSDYVVTEAGFGADLGAEKFYNIKCRIGNIKPSLTVIVATLQGLKLHGGAKQDSLKQPNPEAISKGLENLDQHIENIHSFGQTTVVALNKYDFDMENEINIIRKHCNNKNIPFAVNNSFQQGGNGAVELAKLIVETIENNPSKPLKYTYEATDDVRTKIEKITTRIYRASNVQFSDRAEKMLKYITENNIDNYPVCIAKTQYSFSTDPKMIGVAKNFKIKINDIVINNGAQFIVAIAGEIMRMPGLPKIPNAANINIINGRIEGLS